MFTRSKKLKGRSNSSFCQNLSKSQIDRFTLNFVIFVIGVNQLQKSPRGTRRNNPMTYVSGVIMSNQYNFALEFGYCGYGDHFWDILILEPIDKQHFGDENFSAVCMDSRLLNGWWAAKAASP
jgi:hypothetical protein